MRRILQTLAALALIASASPQLSKAEREGLSQVLYVGNMTLGDLEFARRIFEPPLRPALTDLALDKPLEGADEILAVHALAAQGEASNLIEGARARLLGDKPEVRPLSVLSAPRGESGLPPALEAIVERLALNVAQANADVREALQELTAEEQRYLIENLPAWATEEPSIRFDFSPDPKPDAARIVGLVSRIDLPLIRRAAVMLAKSVEDSGKALRGVVAQGPLFTGIVRFTSYGMKIVVAGTGDDHHVDKDAVITLDLGGNDRYTGRHGAGPGYASILLDLSGNDVYDVQDLSVGAGLLGVGLAYDLGGHDVFRGKSLGFGVGIAGVGVLFKDGGNDLYSAASISLGFGEFGIGIVLDTRGDDRYSVAFQGQGAARSGGVGWIVDRSGDDLYRAGGLVVNSPLFEDVHYSNAQGWAAGYREDTGGLGGGVGLLTDFAGDDAYVGETYCQAASYWFSVGSLYDGAGHDTYTAYHYAQSSAMHACAAYLFDLSGDDAYVVKYGAAHAIGHDYAVAMLLDRAGSDVIAGRDSRPGTGSANGVGIFLDGAGDDRYFGPPAAGVAARGSGSLGVFADLGGADRYASGLQDDAGTARESWAVALDADPSKPQAAVAPAPARPAPTPGTVAMKPPQQMETLYQTATQWGVGTAQEAVAEALDTLASIGEPALDWMLKNKLKTATRLHVRAFVSVVNSLGDRGREMLAPYVADPDDDVARVALGVAIDARCVQAGTHLAQALGRPALQRTAVRAAGALGAKAAVPELMVLAASTDRMLALAAVVSMGQIADPQTLGTGQFLLGSPDLPIRKAAIQLVCRFPSGAMATAKLMVEDPDETRARTGVELLAALGTPEALEAAGSALSDNRPGVRIQALLALSGRCPEAHKARMAELKDDPHALVRAVAREALRGER